jgi:hypothetical protein
MQMFGPDRNDAELRGIVPRTAQAIFDHIHNDKRCGRSCMDRSVLTSDLLCARSGTEYTIKCSFIEIYKEMVRDLFNPKNSNMRVRESPAKGRSIAPPFTGDGSY